MTWKPFLALFFVFALLGCTQSPESEVPEDGEFASVTNINAFCVSLAKKIDAEKESLGACKSASDCAAIRLGSCEFGCYLAKNRQESAAEMISMVKQFEKSACSTCALECGQTLPLTDCVAGKCAIIEQGPVGNTYLKDSLE